MIVTTINYKRKKRNIEIKNNHTDLFENFGGNIEIV
jgi:hypothetical protein